VGHRHGRRDRAGTGRALVGGGIHAHAQPDVDLFAFVACGHRDGAGILHGTVTQLRGGRVLDVTVGHATGQRCAALRVVRPGRGHRQRAADADQQRLVGRGKIQLQALAAVVLDHRRADVRLGVLPGTIHRRTAGQGDAELGLRRLRALPLPRCCIPTTQQALGLVEVRGQPGAAVAVCLVGHAFQRGHLAERTGLE